MNRDVEQIIMDKVEENRAKIIAFVQKIVQIPSLTGEEYAVGQAIYQAMQEWGLDDVQLVEKESKHPNLLARVNGKKDGPTFIFNGHMDVVPPGDEKAWDDPPFSGKIIDGKLYGRGTSDMKAGTCTSVLAAAILKQTGLPLAGNILLTVVCDEEVCGDRGVVYLLEQNLVQGDMGINCEPTNLAHVNIAHKGILKLQIVVHGKNAHGSRPWLGHNAIDDAVKVIAKVHDLAARIKTKTHPMLTGPTILVATIAGGEAMNIVPDSCTIGICRRLLPSESKEEAIADFQGILDELQATDPEFRAELTVWKGFRPAMDLPPDSPMIGIIQKAHQYVKGEALPVGVAGGGTDAAFIINKIGISMPVYGPGNAEIIAKPNEYVETEALIDAVKVYALAVYYALGIEKET